jgi:outer membrane protein OmpA-like peptidoglycan-associated protein
MKKVMICLTGCLLLAVTIGRAQASNPVAADSTRPLMDTTINGTDTTIRFHDPSSKDTAVIQQQLKDTTVQPVNPPVSTVNPAAQTPATQTPTGTTTAASDPASTPVVKDTSIARTDPPANVDPPARTDPPTNVNPSATPQDTVAKDNAVAKADLPAKVQDTAADDKPEQTRGVDTRWFISPLMKLQFQDFAMIEKDREGYLSNANTLPFFQRGNASFAASAYKNITGRLSVSGDIGLSFGHVTSDAVEISQTKSQTFNLLNLSVFYHLLPASYKLQPYVTVGINDIINNGSYLTVPMGVGAKFNGKKVMVLGQVSYGAGLGKNIANSTMYTMGVYIPIRNKKSKQLDNDDNSPWNRPGKDDSGKKKAKDSTAKNNGGTVINNIYVTVNIDSVLRAKGLLGDDGNSSSAGGGRRGNGNGNGDGDDQYASGGSRGAYGGGSGHRRMRRGLHNFDVDDFENDDYAMDSLDGRPVIRFVVYFEFNDYGLNTKAFGNIDKVIGHLRRSPNDFSVEIKGYTDSVGGDHYNNWLSRERAKMVLSYMNSRGIPVEYMKAKAYGKDDPVADNGDPNAAWLNRRAEIIVHEKGALATDK